LLSVVQVLTQLSKTSVVIDVINTKHHKTYADKVGGRAPVKHQYHSLRSSTAQAIISSNKSTFKLERAGWKHCRLLQEAVVEYAPHSRAYAGPAHLTWVGS
jgi:hypothetical protein